MLSVKIPEMSDGDAYFLIYPIVACCPVKLPSGPIDGGRP